MYMHVDIGAERIKQWCFEDKLNHLWTDRNAVKQKHAKLETLYFVPVADVSAFAAYSQLKLNHVVKSLPFKLNFLNYVI